MRIILISFLLFFPLFAYAQETAPGDACTAGQTNWTKQVGGPETAGTVNILRCDGSNWQSAITFTSAGMVGIGTIWPDSPLLVSKTDTNSSGGFYKNISSRYYVSPSANQLTGLAPTGHMSIALEGTAEIPADSTNSVNQIVGMAASALRYSSSDTQKIQGLMGYAESGASGNVDSVLGGELGSYISDGTINKATGGYMYSYIDNGGSAINQTGLDVYSAVAGTGSVTDQVGIAVFLDGNPTKRFGFYMGGNGAATTANNNFGIYQEGANFINRFEGKIVVGTWTPQSSLHISDGYYAQFEDNNAGPPPSADCNNNNERGRLSIDTTNNRLYICNGATRGWDYVTMTN